MDLLDVDIGGASMMASGGAAAALDPWGADGATASSSAGAAGILRDPWSGSNSAVTSPQDPWANSGGAHATNITPAPVAAGNLI